MYLIFFVNVSLFFSMLFFGGSYMVGTLPLMFAGFCIDCSHPFDFWKQKRKTQRLRMLNSGHAFETLIGTISARGVLFILEDVVTQAEGKELVGQRKIRLSIQLALDHLDVRVATVTHRSGSPWRTVFAHELVAL